MFPRPRYHAPKRWEQERAIEIRAAATTLARLLGTGTRHDEWRGRSWQPRQRRWVPRAEPQRFYGPPRRSFSRRAEPQQWRPYTCYEPRWLGGWQRGGQRAYPHDWRPWVLQRRDPPVAAIKVPHRYQQESWEMRRPCGFKPRDPLRGGPERSAGDLQRNPRGGLCGGPARSAKEPQTPKPTRVETNGEITGTQRWQK